MWLDCKEQKDEKDVAKRGKEENTTEEEDCPVSSNSYKLICMNLNLNFCSIYQWKIVWSNKFQIIYLFNDNGVTL